MWKSRQVASYSLFATPYAFLTSNAPRMNVSRSMHLIHDNENKMKLYSFYKGEI